jgi:hypothetical protein
VLVCLSQGSINKSGYVQREIKAALDVADEQPQGEIFVVPCKLEECDVPLRLRQWQWVELFSEHGFQRLMLSLTHRAARIHTASRPPIPAESAYSKPAEGVALDADNTRRKSSRVAPKRRYLRPKAPGIEQLKHIVVLMMENRSFDHMLGYMMARDARIDGVDGTQTNPDTTGTLVPVQPLAQYQTQLQPDPGHDYPDVDLQIFGEPNICERCRVWRPSRWPVGRSSAGTVLMTPWPSTAVLQAKTWPFF